MGKKSSDVPQPDPRLVQAQIKSMGIQDSAITQVMALAKQQQEQNASLIPLQRETMQFGLDSAKTAYDQSQSDREWLLGRRGALTGVQDQMVKDAAEFNTEAAGERQANANMADVSKAYEDVKAGNARALMSMGVNPASGRNPATTGAGDVDLARTLAASANAGRTQARQEGRMLTDRVGNALAGYPAQSQAATGQGAALAAGGLGVVNSGAGGINAGYGAMTGTVGSGASVAGQMGANASSMWGQQANYKLQADQAAQQDLGGIGSLMGGAAKLYTSGIFSAREYKQDIERIGTHPRLGIGLYRYRYRAPFRAKMGAGWHQGVMADELAAVLPGAVGVDPDGYTVVDYSQI